MQSVHLPILLNTIVQFLTENLKKPLENKEQKKKWILDCTFGGGGHSRALLVEIKKKNLTDFYGVIGLDQDEKAILSAQINFKNEIMEGLLKLFHGPMSQASLLFKDFSIIGILADIGYSSDQIEDPSRGLSFQLDGPLDMRMNTQRNTTAYELLCSLSQNELEKIIFDYGEERFAASISKKIVEARKKKELPKTTLELARLVSHAVPKALRFGRIHPATKTFQALRIAINEELEELDTLLEDVILLLESGGRAAVLTFHSLEDRRVKNKFKELAQSKDEFRLLFKKPIVPQSDEQKENPRSRSAKLRVLEKC